MEPKVEEVFKYGENLCLGFLKSVVLMRDSNVTGLPYLPWGGRIIFDFSNTGGPTASANSDLAAWIHPALWDQPHFPYLLSFILPRSWVGAKAGSHPPQTPTQSAAPQLHLQPP